MVLFYEWTYLQYSRALPPITIQEESMYSVDPYPLGVLYYTSGWILQRLSFAKTKKSSIRSVFSDFADFHSLSCDKAKAANLPVELVEDRHVSKLVFSHKSFFHFIQLVESIYIDNLTTDKMITYDDGSLIQHIDHHICNNNYVKDEFVLLVEKDIDSNIFLRIFSFILLRFRQIQGSWFDKSLRAEQGKLKDVDEFSTCTQVITKSDISKQNADSLSGLSEMYIAANNNLNKKDESSNDSSDNSYDEGCVTSKTIIEDSDLDSD